MEPLDTDILIAGGGVAGLTFALQLRKEAPLARVLLVESQARPLPEACHKVGESCVELTSHYLCNVLGLFPYLEEHQLRKNGLRFYCGDSSLPPTERTEVGPGERPRFASFQLDRGTFETALRERVEAAGVELYEGCKAQSFRLGNPHRLTVTQAGKTREISCRWLVDATGRRRLIQKELRLGIPSTVRSSSSWFRVKGRIKPGDLVPESSYQEWRARDLDDSRWRSTVHLCGRGYWVWLIPLSSGYTSVGIVADTEHHDFSTFSTEERSRQWLAAHEPWVDRIVSPLRFEDFRVMRDYAYSTTRAFSEDRWACLGEAGLFVDPLYSLGGDFIALGNSFTTELIKDDLAGRLSVERVEELNRIYLATERNAERMLGDNGEIFAHPEVLGAKLWWDFFFYWSWMSRYYIGEAHKLPAKEARPFHDMGLEYFALNEIAQDVLEAWAVLKEPSKPPYRAFIPLPMYPSILADAHIDLKTMREPPATLEKMRVDLTLGRELISEIVLRALRDLGSERAEQFVRRTGVGGRDGVFVPPERIAIESLEGPARRHSLPRAARDLERALGPSPRKNELSDLMIAFERASVQHPKAL